MKKKLQALKALAVRNRAGVATGVALLPMAARAEVDVSTVTTAITAGAVAVGTVALAVLSLKVGVKVYHWISQSMR